MRKEKGLTIQDMDIPLEAGEPIIFNGEALPLSMYWMELLTVILQNLTSNSQEVLLDLHYCGGVTKVRSSEDMLIFCSEIRYNRRMSRDKIKSELQDRLPFADADRIWIEWISSIDQIEDAAGMNTNCEWTRRSLVARDSASAMLNYLDRVAPMDGTESDLSE